MENLFMRLLNPALIWIFIPITWLVLTTIFETIKVTQRHRERMALINQGIHPDLEPERDATEIDELVGELDSVSRETMDYETAS